MVGSPNTPEFDVFVSYSSKEKAVADAVVSALENEGIRCWYAPRDIAPGADWADSITQAIHECRIMILVFSKHANRSQRVIDEINYAISQEKIILPFRIEAYNPTGALSLHLSSRHWLDAYEPSWEAHLDRLVKSVSLNLESAGDTLQISGGKDDALVEGAAGGRRTNLRYVFLLTGIVILGLGGFLGWNALAVDSDSMLKETEVAVESTMSPTAAPQLTTTPTEVQPSPTATPRFAASIESAMIAYDEIDSLDPQTGGDAENLLSRHFFLGLTKFDPEKAEIVPSAASSWTVSPDGTIYTFTLHPDIPWVQHSLDGETVQVVDENENPRFLTAEDFEFGYKRMCDPSVNEYYAQLLDNVVGCREVGHQQDPENISPEMMDQIGVEAISETELIIRLIEPSASFLTKTSHPLLVAVPSWAVEKYDQAWTNPGLITTNGPFVIDEWVSGENIKLVRNPLLPEDLHGEGNLQNVELRVVEDNEEAYQMWLDELFDYTELPWEKQESHFKNYPDQIEKFNQQVVHYAVFNQGSSPFDNLHLRRAFSAALDRDHLLSEIIKIDGLPMKHLAPPGVFGAAPVDEVGVGFNLDYARNELELAGYPDCQGVSPIFFYGFSGFSTTYGEEIARFWEKSLGCPEGTIVYQGSIVGLFQNAEQWDDWDLIIAGWGGDFPDQDNWVGTLLSCGFDGPMRPNRECDEIDDLIKQARIEISPSDRVDLYWQIEEAFFGEQGTFPMAPLYSPYRYFAARAWVDLAQPARFVDVDWVNSSLDGEAKQAALGE
jgi:oligopeptide transport system substrate-binding protein